MKINIKWGMYMKRLKELRLELGLTQEELAKKFNKEHGTRYTKSAISLMENGERFPEVKNIEKFADFFKVPPGYLMGWSINASGEYNYFTVKFPSHVESEDEEGTSVIRASTAKDIFDLFYLLDSSPSIDIYYKDEKISDEEKKKILVMLQTILE